MRSRFAHRSLLLSLVGLFALGLTVGYFGFGHEAVGFRDVDGELRVTRREYGTSDQILLLFYVSSECHWCSREELPSLLARIKDRLATTAASRGVGFVSMGVALDWSPEVGIRFLDRFGAFDQVSAGYYFGNAAAVEFRGLPTIYSIPQIIVLRRTLEGADPGVPGALAVKNPHLLVRKVGLYEIRDWLERGAPLPTTP